MNKIVKWLGLGAALSLPMSAVIAEEGVASSAWTPAAVQHMVDANDISRNQLANALINYEAQARLKAYQLEEEKMFMAAPGSPGAIQAGIDLGKDAATFSQNVINIGSEAVARGMPVSDGSDVNPGAAALANLAEPYLVSGNPALLGPFNAANILQEDVVELESSKTLINLITNPNPSPIVVVKEGNDIKWGPEATDQDKVADKLVEQALMSVAANALGEIAAKRVVNTETNKSLQQLLREESERRFTNVEWYQNVGVSSQEALLRELNQIEAFKVLLMYHSYRLQEQNAALLSAMVSGIAKMSAVMGMMSKQMAQDKPDIEDFEEPEVDIPEFD